MRSLSSLAGLALLASCAPSVPATLPDPNADVGLGDVAMLVWTTRSPSGLLGYARDQGSGKIDANRKVVDGTPRFTPTQQHLVVVSAQTVAAGAGVGVQGISASLDVNRAKRSCFTGADLEELVVLARDDAQHVWPVRLASTGEVRILLPQSPAVPRGVELELVVYRAPRHSGGLDRKGLVLSTFTLPASAPNAGP